MTGRSTTPCATCAAVARHPHLRCDDHPFSGAAPPARLAGVVSTSGVWCSGDECLALWPEGPLPAGWTVENVEGRVEPCCPDCTAFYAEQTPPARVLSSDGGPADA